jgi:DNA-binding NarL/FixJ family response regulator
MQSQDRVEKLLALLLLHQLKSSPQQDKILNLSVAGFTNTEIADLLQTTSASVSQTLYMSRSKPRARPKKTSKSR